MELDDLIGTETDSNVSSNSEYNEKYTKLPRKIASSKKSRDILTSELDHPVATLYDVNSAVWMTLPDESVVFNASLSNDIIESPTELFLHLFKKSIEYLHT